MECAHCHVTFYKGQIVRSWNGMVFCNEYDQASYMLTKGIATQRPAPSDCRSHYNHYIFKGQPIKVYEGRVFCDFYEFVDYLVEYGIGMTEIVGEKVNAF